MLVDYVDWLSYVKSHHMVILSFSLSYQPYVVIGDSDVGDIVMLVT